MKVVRQELLAEKIVVIDGQPGCGKTMLSPITASMKRVELLSFAFEIEFICRLHYLKKIDNDAAIAMVRVLADHKLYQTMMGRDTNFRYSDQSSVFQDANPWRYFRRIFQDGDMVIPDRIKKERPILNLSTHDLLGMSEPLLSGVGDSILLIEVVRHPLYMVLQQKLNNERLLNNTRDVNIYMEYKSKELPYFALGWEDLFLKSNAMEKAIYNIQRMTNSSYEGRVMWMEKSKNSIITIPFEKFVIDPWPFIKKIELKLDTTIGSKTRNVMKKQKVPRSILSDGPDTKLYRRCGWTPPSGGTEEDELTIRRDIVANNVSSEALKVMDKLSEDYTKEFM